MKVSIITGGPRDEVRRIATTRGRGVVRTIRVIDAREDDRDVADSVPVRVVRPGYGVVSRMRVFQTTDGGRRREQSSLLRPLERSVRRLARREIEIATNYLVRHERSNSRERNGWLKDLSRNVSRAMRGGR